MAWLPSRLSTLVALLPVCAVLTPASPVAQGVAEYGIIDFEGLPEQTRITQQYAALGVAFSIAGAPALSPLIATVGEPAVAFRGCGGTAESEFFDGVAGLTDPIESGSIVFGRDIRIDFNPPVSYCSFYGLHIGIGSCRAEALHRTTIYQNGTFHHDDANGNFPIVYAKVFLSSVTSATGSPVTALVVRPRVGQLGSAASPVDYAIDTVVFRRPSQQPNVGPFIRVAQESAPGAGDFDSNVLGIILPWRAPVAQQLSAAQLYRYGVDVAVNPAGRRRSFGVSLVNTRPDRAHCFFAETTDGLTLFSVLGTSPVVRDGAPTNTQAGHAEMKLSVAGSSTVTRTVLDDPNDSFFPPTGNSFAASWTWPIAETDGQALSGLTGNWSIIGAFTETDGNLSTAPIQGLTSWRAYSATGLELDIALAADRRVQFLAVPGVQAATSAYGVACGAPPLQIASTLGSRPLLGAVHVTDITNVPAASAFMALGFSRTAFGTFTLPWSLASLGMANCWLHNDLVLLQACPMTGPSTARFVLPIPNDLRLLGLKAFLQGWAVAPSANPAGMVNSNGLELTLGSY